MKEREEFHKGIPYVHQSYLRYFFITKQYEDVLKVATTLLRFEAMRDPLQYAVICHIDRELMPAKDGAVVERPKEETLDTGLE